MRTLRWILAIPAGFVASWLVGGVAGWASEFLGGSSWYVWMMSGAFSAVAFFATAFRVAPARDKRLSWLLVALVGLLGTMSALGALVGKDPISALAGLTMVLFAFYQGKETLKTPVGQEVAVI